MRFRGQRRPTRRSSAAIFSSSCCRIGVLGDVRTRDVTTTRPTVYVPVEQVPDNLLALVHGYFQVSWALRTRDEGAGLIQSVDRVIKEADPLLSIAAFRTTDEVVGQALAATRFRTLLPGLFAATSLTRISHQRSSRGRRDAVVTGRTD